MTKISDLTIVGGNSGNIVLTLLDSSTTSKDRNTDEARFNIETRANTELSITNRNEALDELLNTEIIIEFADERKRVVRITDGKTSRDRNTDEARFHLTAKTDELPLSDRRAILDELKDTDIFLQVE